MASESSLANETAINEMMEPVILRGASRYSRARSHEKDAHKGGFLQEGKRETLG